MKLLRSRATRTAIFVLSALTLFLGWLLCRNWSDLRSAVELRIRSSDYRTSPDPILRRLARGKIKAGDSIEVLIRAFPPRSALRHDEFVTVSYGPPDVIGGTHIIAKHGRIVTAYESWICGHQLFFDTFTESEQRAYESSYSAATNRLVEARKAAALAVAGFGATFDPRNLPEPEPEN